MSASTKSALEKIVFIAITAFHSKTNPGAHSALFYVVRKLKIQLLYHGDIKKIQKKLETLK